MTNSALKRGMAPSAAAAGEAVFPFFTGALQQGRLCPVDELRAMRKKRTDGRGRPQQKSRLGWPFGGLLTNLLVVPFFRSRMGYAARYGDLSASSSGGERIPC